MHLVCLGVVRRILIYLKKGPRICKLSAHLVNRISGNLISLNGQLPSEFARQPRSLDDLERWKATEFRQFLLYTGPLVLKGVVAQNVYDNFLTLMVPISFLLDSHDDKRNNYSAYARQLLKYFIMQCTNVFGNTFNVYNVHNLSHLSDDVEHFQCSLNDVSAFPFENNLQLIKKLVRNSRNPVAQVVKRISESDKAGTVHAESSHFRYISARRKDRCFLLRSEEFVIIQEKERMVIVFAIFLKIATCTVSSSIHVIQNYLILSTLVNIIWVKERDKFYTNHNCTGRLFVWYIMMAMCYCQCFMEKNDNE